MPHPRCILHVDTPYFISGRRETSIHAVLAFHHTDQLITTRVTIRVQAPLESTLDGFLQRSFDLSQTWRR